MKIEHTEIYGFRAALRGMRNPMDSWADSDSAFFRFDMRHQIPYWIDIRGQEVGTTRGVEAVPATGCDVAAESPCIGLKDMELALKLIRRGGDHRKFLRYIVVWCDFVLPRYVWQEVDTYKIGTVRNSCSTMNTLGKRHLTQEDFENPLPQLFLDELNRAVDDFREADGAKAKRAERVTMKDLLPEGFLQRATYLLNYEVGLRMFISRRHHRLPMWREGCEGSICAWIKSWPYMHQHFLNAFG